MRRTRPSTYAVGLALTAILVVAGCTSNPTPTPGGSSTPPAASTTSASTTSSATPTATSATSTTSEPSTAATDPNVPAAAKAQTTDGAIAFTKYFFDLVNTSWTKPAAGLLTSHFTPACSTCQNFEDSAAQYVGAKTRYDRTPIDAQEISSHGPAKPGALQTIDVAYHQFPARVIDVTGKSVEDIKEVKGVLVADLAWTNGTWKLTSIKVMQ